MGQQGVGNTGSPIFVLDTRSSSGSDSGKEPTDELDSDYDSLGTKVDV